MDLDVFGDFANLPAGGLVTGAYPILRSPGFLEVSEIVGVEIEWAEFMCENKPLRESNPTNGQRMPRPLPPPLLDDVNPETHSCKILRP